MACVHGVAVAARATGCAFSDDKEAFLQGRRRRTEGHSRCAGIQRRPESLPREPDSVLGTRFGGQNNRISANPQSRERVADRQPESKRNDFRRRHDRGQARLLRIRDRCRARLDAWCGGSRQDGCRRRHGRRRTCIGEPTRCCGRCRDIHFRRTTERSRR